MLPLLKFAAPDALPAQSRIPAGAVTLGEYRRAQRRDAERPDYAGVLVEQLKAAGVASENILREYEFHPKRKWRFDLAIVSVLQSLGIEINGGLWSKSKQAEAAHRFRESIVRDYEKNNAAVMLGWKVLYFVPEQIAKPDGTWVSEAMSVIEATLSNT